ncbi:CREB3 regulatory factor isoform X2 [Salmo trutta]|uniref:CREB3 regulatory factor-like n=1 Tax=Salmo trutta TaxID=8032 RepID=A0A674B751_SALTR|nr:CREB3 regulatory factor-like isoform X2 [Salmo trutta]XP_029554656.1 CREB3 regulatory factor-like isoform X2 [Salmo trutta]XP_029554657.1 CREB3 regulatory factor-like isoform X2 [Salmo trutta]
MPQPGSSGMEPFFGEAYGTHGLSVTSEPFTISPTGGSIESDQCVVVMLGPPALSLCRGQQHGCELLSDLLEDSTTDDKHTSERRWDVSALDDITRYIKGSPERTPPSCERSSISPEGSREEPWLSQRPGGRQLRNPTDLTPCVGLVAGHLPLAGRDPGPWNQEAGGRESEARKGLHQVVQEERISLPVDLEVHSEEHNYSLQSELDTESSQGTDCDIGEEEKEEEDEEGREAMEEVEEKEELQPHVRPNKRWCYWECSLYSEADLGRDGERDSRRAKGRDEEKDEEKDGGDIIWGPSTLPSTMCLIGGTSTNGKQGQRKARRTDASDLTPSPVKLQSLGEQLHTLSSALEGMTPVSDLPVTARAPTRKERNKLASRACRLKKKAQHEANKIKLWGLNQEYDGLLGAVLQIKELIRQRVESREEDTERGALRERLEDILKESAGPRVAGRGKVFVERILKNHAGGQSTRETQGEGGSLDPSL